MILAEGKVQDRIAIVYGRFQPLTVSHYEMMKKLVDQYQQVFIFPVQALSAYTLKAKTEKGKASERHRKMSRSPLPVGLRADLISKALPSIPKQNIMKLASGSIVVAIDAIKRIHPKVDISNVDVWCGPDEYDAYVNQIDYIKEPPHSKYDIKVKKFDIGTREEVSGTKLRQALTNPDGVKGLSVYKKLVAPPLADEETYNKLRKAMKQLKVPRLESMMPVLLNTISEEVSIGKPSIAIIKLAERTLKKYGFDDLRSYLESSGGFVSDFDSKILEKAEKILVKNNYDDIEDFLDDTKEFR